MPKLFLYGLIMKIRPAALAAALKKLVRVKRHVIEVEQGRFFIDPISHLGFSLLRSREYEPQMSRVLLSVLREGSVFIDLGANEGYFSVIASRQVRPAGKVFSVEPQRRLKPIFQRNMEINDAKNVTLIEQAISNHVGQATLHISPSTDTGATGLVLAYKYPVRTETIRTTTLAEVFRQHKIDSCDLMKIDIEGFEYEAVLGSQQIFLEGRVRRIALQLHPRLMVKRGLRPNDITDFLKKCGYSIDVRYDELVFLAPGSERSPEIGD